MKTRNQVLSTQEKSALKARIDGIDLEPIKFKLVKEHGWTLEYADQIEPLYKAYLFLNAQFPQVVPTKAVDDMWHTHILDTFKYFEDCERVFGEYVHHFPYFGVRSETDAENLENAFDRTNDMFAELGLDLQALSLPPNKEANALDQSSMCSCNGSGGCSGDERIQISAQASMCSCNGSGGCSGDERIQISAQASMCSCNGSGGCSGDERISPNESGAACIGAEDFKKQQVQPIVRPGREQTLALSE